MIDPKTAETVARAALAAARGYYGLSHEWDIKLKEVRMEDESAAVINQLPDYMTATISYDPSRMDTPEEVWRHIGHEVGHLVFTEHTLYAQAVEKHLGGEMPAALFALWQHGNERALGRLERMFVRDRPFPGMEALA